MSSLSRERELQRAELRHGLILGALLLGPSVWAADGYFVPAGEAGMEYESNLGLRSDSGLVQPESSEAYVAEIWALTGVRSQRGYIDLKPRIRFQEYPDQEQLQNSNQYLDLRARYSWLRSYVSVLGGYRREDELQTQSSPAEYDDFDPNDPITDEAGRVVLLSSTRTRMQLRPEFGYQFSEKVGAGISATYQKVGFDSESVIVRDGYDYMVAEAYLDWRLGPRAKIQAGPYVSRYETENNDSRTDATGLTLGFDQQWSQTWSTVANLVVENTEVTRTDIDGKDTSTNWGLTVEAHRTGQLDQWRVSAGRSFNPSDAGTRSAIDQIRVQYDRELAQHWKFTGAVRAYQSRAQGGDFRGNDRNFLRTDLGLVYRMTTTWSVVGGYSYVQEEYEGQASGRADNNIFELKVRYEGLAPQQ